jgi:hypothetical protein
MHALPFLSRRSGRPLSLSLRGHGQAEVAESAAVVGPAAQASHAGGLAHWSVATFASGAATAAAVASVFSDQRDAVHGRRHGACARRDRLRQTSCHMSCWGQSGVLANREDATDTNTAAYGHS